MADTSPEVRYLAPGLPVPSMTPGAPGTCGWCASREPVQLTGIVRLRGAGVRYRMRLCAGCLEWLAQECGNVVIRSADPN